MTKFHKLILEGAAEGLYEKPIFNACPSEEIEHEYPIYTSIDLIIQYDNDNGAHKFAGDDVFMFFTSEQDVQAAWQYIFGEQV